jgi:hypothetical protein
MKRPMAASSRFTPDATLTNGRYELPPSARGVLVLADPPEAGWRMQTPDDEQDTPDAVCPSEDVEGA